MCRGHRSGFGMVGAQAYRGRKQGGSGAVVVGAGASVHPGGSVLGRRPSRGGEVGRITFRPPSAA
jgi:hypothetical protein